MKPNTCFKELFIVFVLFISGCDSDIYKDATIINDIDFVKTDTFTYSGIIDVGVLSVDRIMKADNYYVISANSPTDIIHVYDKDFHMIASWGDKGRAANEFVMPQLCGISDSTITILDNGKKEIMIFDYAGNLMGKTDTKGKLYQQCKELNPGTFLLEYKTHHSLSLYSTSNLDKPIFDFPRYAKVYKDPDVYFGFLEVSREKQTIVYVHQYLRSIVLLNYDGTIKKVIKREPSKEDIGNKGEFDTSNSITYYWGVQILKNSFIVYSINKRATEIMNDYNQNVEFEEYDFDGNPIRKIIINRFISSFCVDGDKIYGELPDEENGLGVFTKKY